jgi:hypothetical protein
MNKLFKIKKNQRTKQKKGRQSGGAGARHPAAGRALPAGHLLLREP